MQAKIHEDEIPFDAADLVIRRRGDSSVQCDQEYRVGKEVLVDITDEAAIQPRRNRT
jgi:hypothetical protein